jgi:hypothetical protein
LSFVKGFILVWFLLVAVLSAMLWRLDTSTNVWTWVTGCDSHPVIGSSGTRLVPSASNAPGARETPSLHADSGGRLWLMLGNGYGAASTSGLFNDVWRFDITSLIWTWMLGSDRANPNSPVFGVIGVAAAANTPPERYLHGSVIDASDNIFVFGGATFVGGGTYVATASSSLMPPFS